MSKLNYQGQCQCGNTAFTMHAKPLLRIICHCTICQEFNNADYADILIFDSKDVELPEEGKVIYKNYAKPPMVERGKCAKCGLPAIEYLDRFYAPKMTVVPTVNVSDQSIVPEVNFHSFYHRRKKDWDDGTKKLSGFLKSQLGFMGYYNKAKRDRK